MDSEIKFVSKVNVELVEAAASDMMVCHAAWVSNYGASRKSPPDERAWDSKLGYIENPEWTEWNKKTTGLIDFLYRNRHMSPFEHGHFTFLVEAPLFVAREFMRHRTWSYNEVSGRYKVMEPTFWLGDEARSQQGKIGNYTFEAAGAELTGLYWAEKQRNIERAWESYKRQLDAGIAKEQAREDLPLSLMTQFYATANPRNVMQFLQLRNDGPALKEIRDVAVLIEEAFAKKMPKTYAAYQKNDWRDKDAEIARLTAELAEARKFTEKYA